jgi:hypothetical protein
MTARLTGSPYMFSRRLGPLLREVRARRLRHSLAPRTRSCPSTWPGNTREGAAGAARLEVVPAAGTSWNTERPGAISERIVRFALLAG